VDANVRRVLARLFDVASATRTPAADRRLERRALPLLPDGRASEFNQALMDLGSAICTARDPRCPACPLAVHCLAYRRGTQARRAVGAAASRRRPLRIRTALVIRRGAQVVIGRRPEGGLLGGLWEFPSAAGRGRRPLARGLARVLPGWKARLVAQELLRVGHQYTHFEESVTACEVRAGREDAGRARAPYQWVKVSALRLYPMGRVDRQIADALARRTRK
jgi:A/G-specific adenine glycosylase